MFNIIASSAPKIVRKFFALGAQQFLIDKKGFRQGEFRRKYLSYFQGAQRRIKLFLSFKTEFDWLALGYGGGNRVRTDDFLLAGQALYQLSYTPISK